MALLRLDGWPVRALGLMLSLGLASCALTPTGPGGSKSVSTRTLGAGSKAGSKAGASVASASKAPAPIPSLGLLLEGRVTVEPSAILTSKLGEVTARGVKLISDNGLGLISDNGLGLISDNGLGLIANNGGSYRLLAAPGALRPVEGMWVKAVSLYDGKVLAGPVATGPDGSYKLGFLKAPEKNLRIVAVVPKKEAEARFTYSTFVPPEAKPVLTSDSTRAMSRYILGVLFGRLNAHVDAAIAGNPPEVDDGDDPATRYLKGLMAKIPPAKLAEANRDGALVTELSERVVSYVDLTMPVFEEFYDLTESIRQLGESLDPQPEVSLVDQVIQLGADRKGIDRLPALLEPYGMPAAEAETLAKQMDDKGSAIGQILLLALYTHQKDILAPLEALAE